MSDQSQRLRVLYDRFSALLLQVQATKPEDAFKVGHPGSGLGPLTQGFDTLLERTQALIGDDPIVAEVIQDLQGVPEVGPHLSASYHVDAKSALIFNINAITHALAPRLMAPTGAPPNVSIEREGLFVAGQRFDALLAATRILATATKSIGLVDGYIGTNLLELMSTKPESVFVNILTKPTKLPPDVRPLASAFNQQYGRTRPLSIRTSDAFHDRFLVIDDSHFYHFGSSLKDIGARGFMFSLIEEPTIVGMLRKSINEEWTKAAVVV